MTWLDKLRIYKRLNQAEADIKLVHVTERANTGTHLKLQKLQDDREAILFDAINVALDRKKKEGTDNDALAHVLKALEQYLA